MNLRTFCKVKLTMIMLYRYLFSLNNVEPKVFEKAKNIALKDPKNVEPKVSKNA